MPNAAAPVRSTKADEGWLARVREQISVSAAGGKISSVRLLGGDAPSSEAERALLRQARAELAEYLDGRRRTFSLPVDLSSLTPFIRDILRATGEIPYGETRSYAWVAEKAGHPRAARAAGGALHRNPVTLLVP